MFVACFRRVYQHHTPSSIDIGSELCMFFSVESYLSCSTIHRSCKHMYELGYYFWS